MEQSENESVGSASQNNFGGSGQLNVTPRSRRVPKVHKKNDHGETPLHVSARKGECRQCKKLLQEGADINALDYAGWTPLHEACAHARFKAAKILLSNGADVNAVSDSGDTPLHDAVAKGCEKLVWLLLHSGADRERTNHAGRKPIDLCPAMCHSVRTLLMSPTVPEKCPSGGDSNIDTSPTDHHVEIRHPLTISIGSPTVGTIKQPTPSPAETVTTIHSETCLQGETSDYHHVSDLHFSEERDHRESVNLDLDRTMLHEEEKQSSSGVLGLCETETNNTQSMGAMVYQRPSWNNEDKPIRSDEALEVEADDMEQDTNSHQEGESLTTEPRRWVRTRGTPRKIAICQEKPAPPVDKKKQRGRKKGKVLPSAARSLALPQVPPTSEDVYEFRCSPEPETNDNVEIIDDQGVSPEAKRQHLEETFLQSHPSGSSSKQEEETPMETSILNETGMSVSEQIDENNGSRKVPPLRISLPRTPSEDNPPIVNLEENTSVAAGTRIGSKRNGRLPKNQVKKETNSEDAATPPPADNGIHRMTRSRVRQAGRSIKDANTFFGYYESNAKRKGQNGSRRSVAPSVSDVASPMPAGSVVEKEENSNSSVETVSDTLGAFAMSLMQASTYDGFCGFRSKIEESWMDVLTQAPASEPDLPSNFDQYLTVKKNFTLKGNIASENLATKVDFGFKLPLELQDLCKNQDEKRLRMELKHKVERERLQALAEREVLRMLNRKANPGRSCLSAVRVLRETDIFNTWYLKERSEDHPILSYEDVKTKFAGQVRLMENRQKMESDALFAEQVYTWNAALKNVTNPAFSLLKDRVPKVSITHLELNL